MSLSSRARADRCVGRRVSRAERRRSTPCAIVGWTTTIEGCCAAVLLVRDGVSRNDAFSAGPLAQLAEQQTLNLRVLGSIPRRLTKFTNEISDQAILRRVVLAGVCNRCATRVCGGSSE